MAIEWARLKPQRPIELGDRGIALRGTGGCRVMLLHGLTGCPTELAYIAHWLRSRGRYHVSCPRLVNHGQPIAVLARTTWRELRDSARQAFFEARRDARAEGVPLVIGGLSLGAILSLMLAAEHPQDIAGVACLAPTLFYDGWSVPWYQRLIPLVAYTPLKYFTYFREREPYGLRDESLRAKMAKRYREARLDDSREAAKVGYAHFPVRLFCEMRHLIARCKRALPGVSSPLLVVQAQHDDVTGPRNARFILERVASPNRSLVLLQHSYHLVSADVERAVVAKRLQEFCAAVAA
ncbi:MAG TPA: alpha/beta fold hydrolase [Burkholderiales bacterium]|nr:alpha/beta fold hydrolase [Burkholderiales bacterium]